MKTIISYKSFTKTTETYAKWLAEELGAEAKTFFRTSRRDLENADACVIMSGTYIGWMPLVGFLKRNWKTIKGKKLIVVAVGAVPPEDPWSMRSYNRIPEKIRAEIKYYKLPGKQSEKNPTGFGPVARDNLKPIIDELRT